MMVMIIVFLPLLYSYLLVRPVHSQEMAGIKGEFYSQIWALM